MTTLIALVGEQPLSNLLPIRHLQPAETVLLYSGRTQLIAERLKLVVTNCDSRPLSSAYEMVTLLAEMRAIIGERKDMVYNITGGTKMMSLAAFAIASQTNSPLVYLQSEGGRNIFLHHTFDPATGMLRMHQETIPTVITLDDYLRIHVGRYTVTGFSRDDQGHLNDGGMLEQAVYDALCQDSDMELLAGVRPVGAAQPIEMDLVLRIGNQVGIVEIKRGGDRERWKRAIEQLSLAAAPQSMGTYTAKFLIAGRKLDKANARLAKQSGITVIILPDYEDGRPLSAATSESLAQRIRARLLPAPVAAPESATP